MVAVAGCGSDPIVPPPPPPVPTQLSLVIQPSSAAQNGVALAAQPVLRLRDAQGVPVALSGVVVTATLASGAGVTLTNATATTDGSGFATFGALTLTGTVGNYTLRFSAGTLAPADANAIQVLAGPPSQLFLATQPAAAAQAGVALSTQPAVRLRDASGNDAGLAGVTVTAQVVAGTVVITSGTAVTSAAGLATFNGLTLSGLIGSYTLRFTATNLAAATAAAATVLAPGAPTQLSLATEPATAAPNGAPLATQPVVRLRDAFGNDAVQAGATVVASIVAGPAGGVIAGDTSLTDATGRAAFGALRITGSVGNYSLRFASTGFAPIVAGAPVALGAGAATRLGLATQPPASAQSGVPMTAVPVVQVQDQSGNAVAQTGVDVTAAVVAGTVGLSNVSATTDAAGRATFTGLTLTGAVNSYLLQFAATGLTGVTAAAATVLLPGSATQLTLSTQPGASAGNTVPLGTQPVVQLRDAQGNAATVAGVIITASVIGGGAALNNTTATTVAAGSATFAGLALIGTIGSYTLRFSAGGLTAVDAAAATVLAAGPAKSITLTAQPATSAVSGAALATQPVAQLRDTSGNVVPQAGVTVTASVVGGGPAVGGATAVTTGAGTATFALLTLSGAPGNYLLRFGSGTLTTADAAAAVALIAGPPALLDIVTLPPATAVNAVAMAAPPVVEVADATGNPLSGVAVSAAASGNVTLANAAATTGLNGRATFPGLTLTGHVSGYSLRFCVGSCATATIVTGSPTPTSLTVGAPATVTLVTAPSSGGQSGTVLARQPVARVTDVSANVIASQTVSATAGAATVAGASAITDQAGVASFTSLGVSGVPGNYSLAFTAAGAIESVPFALSPGAPATMTVDVQPSTAADNGEPFALPPVVTVRDVTGNPVPGMNVIASPSSASVAVVNGSATTNASGSAVFSGIGLAGATGSYTIGFSAGAAAATSNAVTLNAGSASNLSITTQPPVNAVNGVPLAIQPAVHLQDASTNPVANRLVTVSVTSGVVTLAGGTATTNASGDAVFTTLALSGTVGAYTLRFTSGALSVNAAAPTNLGSGVAAALTLANQPSGSAQNNAAFAAQPVVQVTDAGGNAVAQGGAMVTATVVGGGVVVSSGTAVTNGTGAATFSGLKLTGATGFYLLRFSAAGLGNVDAAAPSALGPGSALSLSISTEPSYALLINQALPVQPVVQLRDVSGNAVPQAGVPVTIGSVGGTAALTGTTTVTTDGTGAAFFANVGSSGPQGVHLLRFSSGALTPANAARVTHVAAPLASGTPPAAQGGVADQQTPFAIAVPPGSDSLVVEISGGTGSADLVVRRGDAPDLVNGVWDCYPGLSINDERCVFAAPAAGTWYVVVYGFFSFTGVTLRATVY